MVAGRQKDDFLCNMTKRYLSVQGECFRFLHNLLLYSKYDENAICNSKKHKKMLLYRTRKG